MPQTVIQQAPAIRRGSVKIFFGDTSASLVDIGAVRTPKMTSMAQEQNIDFDNVPDLKQFADGDRVQFSFGLAEINLTNISKFDGGMVNLTTVAGSATPVTAEAKGTGWTQGQPIQITNKNGANTIVTAITVKQAGSALTLNTDYRLYVSDGTNGVLGYTYIVPITAQAAAITVDYTYTPNQSKTVTFNNIGAKVLKYLRVVNTDVNGKKFQIDIQNVTNVTAPAIDFASDGEANVAILPVTLEGYFVSIIDEQQLL